MLRSVSTWSPRKSRSVRSWIETLDRRRLLTASIKGTVYVDANANGAIEASETLPLWTPTIWADLNYDGIRDAGEPSTTQPLPSSSYTLSVAGTGTYLVRVEMPTNYVATTSSLWVNTTNGFSTLGNHFAGYQLGKTGARIFEDDNANGTLDAGEFRADNRTFYADLDGDQQLDANEPASASIDTYLPTLWMRPGTYNFRVIEPLGSTNTNNPSGITQSISGGNAFLPTNLGQHVQPTICGNAYRDNNGNQQYDAGDQGLDGHTVFFDLNDNNVLEPGEPSSLVSAAGFFGLAGPELANDHKLQLLAPGGGAPVQGFFTSGSRFTSTYSFRVAGAGSIEGWYYADYNANNIKDGTDKYVAGVMVYGDVNNNSLWDGNEPRTITNSNGYYLFGAPAGTYRVRVISGNGYSSTANSGPYTITGTTYYQASDKPVTDSLPGRNFTNFMGTVFNDVNRNGYQDAGEVPVANQLVFFDANANGSLDAGEASGSSDADGTYYLGDLTSASGQLPLTVRPGSGWRTVVNGDVEGRFTSQWSGHTSNLDLGIYAVADTGIASATLNVDDSQSLAVVTSANLGSSLNYTDLVLQKEVAGVWTIISRPFNSASPSVVDGVSTIQLRQRSLLGDGKYRLLLRAGTVADVSGKRNLRDTQFDFVILTGDANHDRVVNFDDLLILAQNFGQTGRTFSQGNFNYSADGLVNFDDLLLLAQRYGTSLLDAARVSSGSRRNTGRVASELL